MSAHSSARESVGTMLTGRHVLIGFVLFFGAIFAVNGYFLYSALSTHTGVVSVEPYRKGLAYNDRIAADEAQRQLGWRDVVNVDMSGAFSLQILDKNDKPVPGLAVSALVGRPSTVQFDRILPLSATSSGTYTAAAGALESGSWIVAIEARQDGAATADPVFRSRRRVWLKP